MPLSVEVDGRRGDPALGSEAEMPIGGQLPERRPVELKAGLDQRPAEVSIRERPLPPLQVRDQLCLRGPIKVPPQALAEFPTASLVRLARASWTTLAAQDTASWKGRKSGSVSSLVASSFV